MNVSIPTASGATNMELTPIGQRDGADQGDPQVSAQVIFREGPIHVGSGNANRVDGQSLTAVTPRRLRS